MRPLPFHHRWRAAWTISILAVVILCGCFNPFDPDVRGIGVTEPSPVPDSPANVLRLLEWCYKNRAIFEYRELFDNEYRFVFGVRDPDGNAYRDNPCTREDEVESTTHLFQGGDANQPAASSITIFLDKSFSVGDDPQRPGRWHKLIRTSVQLRIVTDQQREVSGFANFFLVRGDSAVIPEELQQRGFKRDSTRWYILRHEDDTFQDQGAAAAAGASPVQAVHGARPAKATGWPFQVSWGALKHSYR